MLSFPKNFLWGASTSSHQVEGQNYNDWTEWEKKNAVRLAHEAESHFGQLPNWPEIKDKAKDPENYISGNACSHYYNFDSDFEMAKSLGHNAHRMSIEWSRIEPKEGQYNEKEIEHYRQVIKSLREKGLEPFVTLWHWTLPVWLRDKGGWESPAAEPHFLLYVAKIISALGNDVKFWITINEPMVYTTMSYLKGEWPPQKKGWLPYLRATNKLAEVHNNTYKLIKKNNPQAQIGIAHSCTYLEAYKNKIINILLKSFGKWWWNFRFLNKIKDCQDFIGINYYSRVLIHHGLAKVKQGELSDLGQDLYSEGIYYVLKEMARYKKPLYITENGVADARDNRRPQLIQKTLESVSKAISEGVDVRGYLHWSLLDNFEWDKGFWPRFGLVEMDYNTFTRKIRSSAYVYKKIIEDSSI